MQTKRAFVAFSYVKSLFDGDYGDVTLCMMTMICVPKSELISCVWFFFFFFFLSALDDDFCFF